MTFYEELGISQRATEAEIRRSYKRLTLLLHPDQQQDPEIRALAEAQMRRLNEMAAILTDPERRRAYDLSLRANALPVRQLPPMPLVFWFRNNVGWILVGVAFMVFAVSAILIPNFDSARPVASAQNQIAQPTRQESTSKANEIVASAQPVPRTRSTSISTPSLGERQPDNGKWRLSPDLSSPPPPPQAATPSFPAPRIEKAASDAGKVSTTTVPDIRPAPTPQVPPAPAASVPAVDSSAVPALKNSFAEKPTLVGRWVYAPDPSISLDPKLFPAEYVEISIVLVDGRLRGSYRSRYKVSDRKLIPDANFTFSGPVSESLFAWRGDSGSKGEITLHLQSRDTLKVNWFATEMGTGLSLGAGNAVLYRFR